MLHRERKRSSIPHAGWQLQKRKLPTATLATGADTPALSRHSPKTFRPPRYPSGTLEPARDHHRSRRRSVHATRAGSTGRLLSFRRTPTTVISAPSGHSGVSAKGLAGREPASPHLQCGDLLLPTTPRNGSVWNRTTYLSEDAPPEDESPSIRALPELSDPGRCGPRVTRR